MTHVICSLGPDAAARRTIKYLSALLAGAWVVSSDWAAACLAAGSPVGEGPYEAAGDTAGFTGGPAAGRRAAAAREGGGRCKLFEGLEFYIAGERRYGGYLCRARLGRCNLFKGLEVCIAGE